VNADVLLRSIAQLPDHQLASMLVLAVTETAYRHKTSIGDVASLIEGVDPWAPAEDPASHEVRPKLTLAGEVWEKITGRRGLNRSRRRPLN